MKFMKVIQVIYKLCRRLVCVISKMNGTFFSIIKFLGNGVEYSNFRTIGVPYVMVANGGKMRIGKNFAMNNGIKGNPIGRYEKCTFFVDRNCKILIGDNVGISQTALISHCLIQIGNNVKIGGGTCIYTTDFHSLNSDIRRTERDMEYRKCAPVVIKDDVFIGARSIILKGVTIGNKSIVGAGSVVTQSIPDNQIWAGNPAKFIREIK